MRLLEATRKDLLTKNRNETPERYSRRMTYVTTIKPMAVAKDLFIKTGTLTVPINVGDYVVTVHFSQIMKYIREELDRQHKTLPDRPLVYKALRKAVDVSNVYVNCTCPDFNYRFKYWATKKNYLYGEPETRPSDITNPTNRGSICKHITAALVRPSQWLKYVAGWISTLVRAYLENKMDIDTEDIEDLSPKEQEVVRDEISDITDLDDSITKVNRGNNNDQDVDIPFEDIED